MQIGGLKLDVYDHGQELGSHREALEKIGALDANVLPSDELERLPDARFALVGITKRGHKVRRFPIHDAEHTKLAAYFFGLNVRKLPHEVAEKIALRIHAACEEHKVPSPIDVSGVEQETYKAALWDGPIDLSRAPDFTVGMTHQATKTAAAAENDYAVVLEQGGELTGIYYLGTPEALQKAASTFQEDFAELTPELRVQVAQAIQERLVDAGSAVPEKVASYASLEPSPELRHWLIARKSLVPEEAHEVLDELWEKRAEFKGSAMARALESFDRMTGIHEDWDHRIPDPYASCYAAPAELTVKVGSSEMSEDDIRKLAARPGKLAEFFPPEAVVEFQRDPVTVFQSLPMPTKELLAGALEE